MKESVNVTGNAYLTDLNLAKDPMEAEEDTVSLQAVTVLSPQVTVHRHLALLDRVIRPIVTGSQQALINHVIVNRPLQAIDQVPTLHATVSRQATGNSRQVTVDRQ